MRVLPALLAVALVACGDDTPATPDASTTDASTADASSRDAAVPDASPPDGAAPDASPDATPSDGQLSDASFDASDDADLPQTPVLGQMRIVDFRVANDLAGIGLPGGVSMASAGIEFLDPSIANLPAPAFGSDALALGECHVYRYTVGAHDEPIQVDEGTVTLSSVDGAIQPASFPTCAFSAPDDGYRCLATSANAPFSGGSIDHEVSLSASRLTIPGADFTGMVGLAVTVTGFGQAANNGTFTIVSVVETDSVLVFNLDAAIASWDNGLDESSVAGTYHVLGGAESPVPTTFGIDFLDDGTGSMSVAKGPGFHVPAFNVASLSSSGTPLILDSASRTPATFPSSTADYTLSCGNDGTCGNSGGLIVMFILTGRTSDGDLATGCNGPCGPLELPEPITEYATFACRGNVGGANITLPGAAVAEVLGTQPVRVETRLERLTVDVTSDQTGQTAITAGHGIIGWTDIEP